MVEKNPIMVGEKKKPNKKKDYVTINSRPAYNYAQFLSIIYINQRNMEVC